MDAWILDESPGAYRWGDDRPAELGADDVRIRVVASALNHMDLWVTRGLPKPPLPHVPGCDVAGVVDAVGDAVDRRRRRRRGRRQPRRVAGRGHRRPRQRQPDGPGLRHLRRAHVGRARHSPSPRRATSCARPAGRIVGGVRGLPAGVADRLPDAAPGPAARPARRCSSSASARACRAPPSPSPATSAPRSWPPAAARPSGTRRWRWAPSAAIDSADDRWPVQADVVVESVGAATWDQSVRALKAGGRLVVCGGTSGAEVELNLPRLFFKQYEIIGSSMGSYQEFAEVTALDGAGPRRARRPGRSTSPSTRRRSPAWRPASSSARSCCGTERRRRSVGVLHERCATIGRVAASPSA